MTPGRLHPIIQKHCLITIAWMFRGFINLRAAMTGLTKLDYLFTTSTTAIRSSARNWCENLLNSVISSRRNTVYRIIIRLALRQIFSCGSISKNKKPPVLTGGSSESIIISFYKKSFFSSRKPRILVKMCLNFKAFYA